VNEDKLEERKKMRNDSLKDNERRREEEK